MLQLNCLSAKLSGRGLRGDTGRDGHRCPPGGGVVRMGPAPRRCADEVTEINGTRVESRSPAFAAGMIKRSGSGELPYEYFMLTDAIPPKVQEP